MRLLALLLLVAPALAGAQTSPPPVDAEPPSARTPVDEPGDAPPAPASPSLPAVAPGAPPAAGGGLVTTPGRPRFALGNWLINAHVAGGVEPNRYHCSAGTSTCTVAAFGVGGQMLWRGFLGFGVGLYASSGSPLVAGTIPQADGSTVTEPSLGDRISVAGALALRPLAPLAWSLGDSWGSRLMAGFGIEVGPSVEYTRTSSTTTPGCAIPSSNLGVGFHGLASLDVPIVGDTRSGWLAVRVAARLLAGPDAFLAPQSTACVAQVTEPGVSSQLLIGFGYYL